MMIKYDAVKLRLLKSTLTLLWFHFFMHAKLEENIKEIGNNVFRTQILGNIFSYVKMRFL